MIEYITVATLRNFHQENLREEATILKRAAERSPEGATFLSHSSKDAELMAGVVKILRNHGASVYIDKKDESLPPYTSRETAVTLRNRIKQCRKFILFATDNSKDSRWVPWELGISDGYKRAANTAIFPGVESQGDTRWTEREYLGVYDRIVFGDLQGETQKVWMVLNQEKNEGTTLSRWLQP
jgi:hypothetical protein